MWAPDASQIRTCQRKGMESGAERNEMGLDRVFLNSEDSLSGKHFKIVGPGQVFQESNFK